MKLMGRRFVPVSDIQREWLVVIESIKEIHFHGAFDAWNKTMGSLYVLKSLFFGRDGSQN
jgi:hypothetical protein